LPPPRPPPAPAPAGGAAPARKGTVAIIDDGLGPAAPTAPAQKGAAIPPPTATDGVTLKDGTAIFGRVVKQTPGTFVTIETADGTQHTIPWDRVKEVVVAAPAKTK
jgi:hypothetical protein